MKGTKAPNSQVATQGIHILEQLEFLTQFSNLIVDEFFLYSPKSRRWFNEITVKGQRGLVLNKLPLLLLLLHKFSQHDVHRPPNTHSDELTHHPGSLMGGGHFQRQ